MSRIEDTARNALWATITNILYILCGFVSRFVFLRVLNETYLGINSLFSSLIGVLSFADLGLSSAFTFCFYKPISEKDIPHIQAILSAFQKVLWGIIGIILAIGLALIPFLRFFVKGAEYISDGMLIVYYLIALSNTLLSFFLTYKTCYITAAQQAYKLEPFKIAMNLTTVGVQIVVLLVWKNYTIWALCSPVVTIVHNVVVNEYIKKVFPETRYKKAPKLPAEDSESVLRNVKATIIRRFGSVCVKQTDSIIVSSMVSIATTGLLSNYELIKNSVLSIVNVIQKAVIPGLGNLMVSTDEKTQKNVIYTYMMVNYCIIGFAMCGVGILSSPFIALVFGADKTVDEITITLMCIGFYFAYQAYALNALPTAAGKMILGAWVAFVEGFSNLVISIAAVHWVGLPGVYVGTIASQFLSYLIRPFPIFKGIYGEKPYQYFRDTMLYFLSSCLAYGILLLLRANIIGTTATIWNFSIMLVLTPIVFYGTAWLLWHKTKYGKEAIGVIRKILIGLLRR